MQAAQYNRFYYPLPSPPLNFFVELLLRTGNPESFEIYNELNPAEAEIKKQEEDTFDINKITDTHTLNIIKESSVFFLARMGNEKALNTLIEMIRDKDVDFRRDASLLLRELLNQGVLPESPAKRDIFSIPKRPNDEIVFKVVNQLINLLKSDNPSVREWAVFALGTRKDLVVVKSLIEMLHDENPVVRRKASLNLGMIRNPIAVESLITLIEDDNEDVRPYAAQSLGVIGDVRAIEPLIQLIVSEKNTRVIRFAIWALGHIDDKRVLEFLRKLFKSKDQLDIKIQISLASTLARWDRNAVKFLEELSRSLDINVRSEAAYCLAEMNNPNVISTLMDLLGKLEHQNWSWEHRAIRELSKRYPDTVKNALLSAFRGKKFDESSALKVLKAADIRNPKAYLQYLVNKRAMDFSFIPSLTACDFDKAPECCKSTLHPGDEAIAILDNGKETASIHSLDCPEIKPAYWS